MGSPTCPRRRRATPERPENADAGDGRGGSLARERATEERTALKRTKDRARWRRHARETRRALLFHLAVCPPCQESYPDRTPSRACREEVEALVMQWRENKLAGEYARRRTIAAAPARTAGDEPSPHEESRAERSEP